MGCERKKEDDKPKLADKDKKNMRDMEASDLHAFMLATTSKDDALRDRYQSLNLDLFRYMVRGARAIEQMGFQGLLSDFERHVASPTKSDFDIKGRLHDKHCRWGDKWGGSSEKMSRYASMWMGLCVGKEGIDFPNIGRMQYASNKSELSPWEARAWFIAKRKSLTDLERESVANWFIESHTGECPFTGAARPARRHTTGTVARYRKRLEDY